VPTTQAGSTTTADPSTATGATSATHLRAPWWLNRVATDEERQARRDAYTAGSGS
jgi:hypothetical protein